MPNGRIAAAAFLSLLVSAIASGADWPQWRGPNRDAVAPDSPPMIDAIGEGGLKKVWGSEAIPGAGLGGYGQVSVAGDRVYVLVHDRKETTIKERILTRNTLTGQGGFPELPPELAKAVEEARLSEARAKLKNGKDILTWADDWLRANLKPEWGKFSQALRMRLALGAKALPLVLLAKLEPVVDKEFADEAALDAFLKEQGFDDDSRKQILGALPKLKRSAVDRMYALDRATGKTVWTREFPGIWMISPDSSTPLVAEGCCWFFGSGGVLRCLNVKDGTPLWQSKLLVNVVQQHSRSSSPMLAGERIVICTDEALQAIDAKTGAVVWSVAEVQNREASPVLCRIEGRDCVLCVGTGKVFCLDLATGKVLWGARSDASSCTPAVSGDVMVISGGSKDLGLTAYRLSLAEPKLLWSVPFIDPFTSAVILGKHVYAVGGGSGVMAFGEKGKGRALCVELETGKTSWSETIGVAEFSSPVIADGKMLVEAGPSLYLIRAAPDGYQLLGTVDLKLPKWITPTVADGRIYLRTLQNVVCYELRKP